MKIAIFDFNGTIFSRETMPFILSQWYKQKYSQYKLLKVYIPLIPLYLKYKMGLSLNLSKEEMEVKAVRKVSKIFKGMSKNEIDIFFSKAASSASKYFNEKVITEISRCKKNGYYTVLLSGAYKPLLKQVATGFKIDTIIGSEFIYNKNSNSKLKINIISGSKKLYVLKDYFKDEKIDWENSKAYADSFHDLQLLEAVGKPVAVNPDSSLQTIAQKRNWSTICSAD